MPEKIAWVTGATGYWGRKFSLALLRQGWSVIALCRSEPRELLSWAEAQGGQFSWCPFDFEDPDYLEKLDSLPTPQALFHCSALYDESLERMFSVNVFQPVKLISQVQARMAQQGGGRIGILLGQNGRLGLPGLGAFSATQGALWTWAEATARSWRKGHENLSLTLVFPPRAPSRLQGSLAHALGKTVRLKPLKHADELVHAVLSGAPLCGRRPLIAGLLTVMGPVKI